MPRPWPGRRLAISWLDASGPNDSSITLNLGTIGTADGLRQLSSDYVAFVIQNGAEVGELNGVTIDNEGFVIASFTNGATHKIYKLPVATFANPLALDPRTGNVHGQTAASGEFNLRDAGRGRPRHDRTVVARRGQRRSGRGVHQNDRHAARLLSQCARHHNDR